MPPNREEHFMAHPEVYEYLSQFFPILILESDRGAVLLAASQIEEQLKRLFESLLAEGTSNNRKKDIFNYTGPFGSLSSKLDVAYVCRILPGSLVDAIHKLRNLRNNVAHTALSFALREYQKDIDEIFALVGPGVDLGINRMAMELWLKNKLAELMGIERTTDEGDKPLFEDEGSVLKYLLKNREFLKIPPDDLPRWILGLGVCLICGRIIYHRERLVAGLGPSNTLISLLGNEE